MILSLIAAVSENGVIGREGGLPWRLPDDMRWFKETTMGHPVIMGRRTHESNRGPLPGRPNIVVSSSMDENAPGVTVVRSLAEALDAARARPDGDESEAFVIGGSRLYGEALPIANRLYLTRVHAEVEGDTRFPEVDWSCWRLVREDRHEADARHEHAFTFGVFERTG